MFRGRLRRRAEEEAFGEATARVSGGGKQGASVWPGGKGDVRTSCSRFSHVAVAVASRAVSLESDSDEGRAVSLTTRMRDVRSAWKATRMRDVRSA